LSSSYRVGSHGRRPMFRGGYGRVTFVLRRARIAKPVADAPDGLDARGWQLGRGELGAQPGHVDVDGSRLDEAVPTPYGVEQLFAAEDAPRRAGQDRQQLEPLRGQVHRAALHADLAAI